MYFSHIYIDSSIPYHSFREKNETGINGPILQKGKIRSREISSCRWEETKGEASECTRVEKLLTSFASSYRNQLASTQLHLRDAGGLRVRVVGITRRGQFAGQIRSCRSTLSAGEQGRATGRLSGLLNDVKFNLHCLP